MSLRRPAGSRSPDRSARPEEPWGSDGRALAHLEPGPPEPFSLDSAFAGVSAVAFSASASRSRVVSHLPPAEPVVARAGPMARPGRGRTATTRLVTAVVRALPWAAGLVVSAIFVVLIAAPAILPVKVLPVWTGSMEPTIHVGAAVVVEEISADRIKVGDVITFRRSDELQDLVTHRVVKIEHQSDGQTVFVTKGDANGSQDPWRVPAVGVGLHERFSIPYLGYAYGWLHSSYGRFGLFAVVVAGLGALLISWVWRRPEPKTALA